MPNINTKLVNSTHKSKGFSDDEVITFEIFDRRKFRLLKVKVICEVFEGVSSYSIKIDDVPFLDVTHNPKMKEQYNIEYDMFFRGGE